ncbi:unnamed protein product, partial [Arabidopsis halleri]
MGPVPFAAKDLVVHDLFLQDTVEWNASFINALLPDYSSEILAIKPSRLGAADKLVWLGQPSGSYSSKSGYHFANNGFSPSPPSTRTDPINWKSDVWGILSAPKVKIFLWKTLQAALPTEVWKAAPLVPALPCHLLESVNDGFTRAKLQVCLPPTGLSFCPLFPWICWNLWKSRNQKLFNARSFSSEETSLKALSDAKEWQDAQCKGPVKLLPTAEPFCQASTSVASLIVNCKSDAAWRPDLNAAGLGLVLSDPVADTTFRLSAVCEHVPSPLMAEGLSCRAALMDARSKNISHLNLESDCQLLIQAIKTRSIIAEIHGVLSDISICIASFSSFACRYIPRSANLVADSLAKSALSFRGYGLHVVNEVVSLLPQSVDDGLSDKLPESCRRGTISIVSGTVFTLSNRCSFTVWPGILTAKSTLIGDGGFALASGSSVNLTVSPGWSGRFWGRTGCNFDASGSGKCTTVDCGGKLKCAGAEGAPPTTLAEFRIGSSRKIYAVQDSYNVSLVDGYNVQMKITPQGGSGNCKTVGCVSDVNAICPNELRVTDSKGVVACKSACEAFNKPEYCCTGAFNRLETCPPTKYSKIFKGACPTAYSYV